MGENSMSCGISVRGFVLKQPTEIAVEYKNGKIAFCGEVLLKDSLFSELLSLMDRQISEQFGKYADDILSTPLASVKLYHVNEMTGFKMDTPDLFFQAAKKARSTAVLFSFRAGISCDDKSSQETKGLMKVINAVADFLGLKTFFLFGRVGNAIGIEQLMDRLKETENIPALPVQMREASFVTFSHLILDGSGIFQKAMRELFGLKETWLFIVVKKDMFTAIAGIPDISNKIIECSGMYLELGTERGKIVMGIRGQMILKLLRGIRFTVACRIGLTSFMLEAYAEVKSPVKLIGPLCIGDTCLAVGFGTGLEFGMFSTLYIGKINLFGAVMLAQTPAGVNVELVCAAFSDLTLPLIIESVTGLQISGIACLDFIKVLGLPFQQMQAFDASIIQSADEQAVVRHFNEQLSEKSLVLSAGKVKVSPYDGGLNLVDQRRMRHYYIDRQGRLSLKAQFYYASVNKSLGDYTIERGIFLCGVIEIFKLHFEVLFSFRESDGVLAYARIAELDLGFLKLTESKYNSANENTMPLPVDSVLYQFMGSQQKGIVFFLSASQKDISFYFDGRIELLSLFYLEAKIIFCKGLISIDAGFELWGILEVSLHLKLDYSSFTKGGFEFVLIVSTAKLTEKLQAVQRKINQAIGKYRDKINDAKREIDRAQAHVNELYSQIASLNRRIDDCKDDIKHAKWWKKAFVAIAKGIQIAAYEVAKAGVYAAIGVATAVLAVAKKVVDLSGKVGETVLKAVNGIITGFMSLFYLNKIELSALANKNTRQFSAAISFVALGKTYNISTGYHAESLQSNPQGVLSDSINNTMDYDLNHMEDGTFRSNRRRYKHETLTVEQNTVRMRQAVSQLSGATSLLMNMQNNYMDEFNEIMPEFDEMNTSYADALDTVTGLLETVHMPDEMKNLSRAMGGLKRSVSAREKRGMYRAQEVSELKEVIQAYDETKVLYDQIQKGIYAVEKQRRNVKELAAGQQIKEAAFRSRSMTQNNRRRGSLERVLNRTEENMYKSFPMDRGTGNFINLSREKLIRQYLDEARREVDAQPSEKIVEMRNRTRTDAYENRL